MTPGPEVSNRAEVSFGVGMAEPEVLSHAKRRRCVLPVIQAIRSDPAFGQLYVMAIQARVNSPPIKKKK